MDMNNINGLCFLDDLLRVGAGLQLEGFWLLVQGFDEAQLRVIDELTKETLLTDFKYRPEGYLGVTEENLKLMKQVLLVLRLETVLWVKSGMTNGATFEQTSRYITPDLYLEQYTKESLKSMEPKERVEIIKAKKIPLTKGGKKEDIIKNALIKYTDDLNLANPASLNRIADTWPRTQIHLPGILRDELQDLRGVYNKNFKADSDGDRDSKTYVKRDDYNDLLALFSSAELDQPAHSDTAFFSSERNSFKIFNTVLQRFPTQTYSGKILRSIYVIVMDLKETRRPKFYLEGSENCESHSMGLGIYRVLIKSPSTSFAPKLMVYYEETERENADFFELLTIKCTQKAEGYEPPKCNLISLKYDEFHILGEFKDSNGHMDAAHPGYPLSVEFSFGKEDCVPVKFRNITFVKEFWIKFPNPLADAPRGIPINVRLFYTRGKHLDNSSKDIKQFTILFNSSGKLVTNVPTLDEVLSLHKDNLFIKPFEDPTLEIENLYHLFNDENLILRNLIEFQTLRTRGLSSHTAQLELFLTLAKVLKHYPVNTQRAQIAFDYPLLFDQILSILSDTSLSELILTISKIFKNRKTKRIDDDGENQSSKRQKPDDDDEDDDDDNNNNV